MMIHKQQVKFGHQVLILIRLKTVRGGEVLRQSEVERSAAFKADTFLWAVLDCAVQGWTGLYCTNLYEPVL